MQRTQPCTSHISLFFPVFLFFTQTYVQHLIGKQQPKVWELMRDPKCHTYVCGDSSMGEDVKAEVGMNETHRIVDGLSKERPTLYRYYRRV